MGALVKSRAVGYSMGGYGAGMSIYHNFLARGQDIVFPKNTAMEIGIGTRAAISASATEPAAVSPYAESAGSQ